MGKDVGLSLYRVAGKFDERTKFIRMLRLFYLGRNSHRRKGVRKIAGHCSLNRDERSVVPHSRLGREHGIDRIPLYCTENTDMKCIATCMK